ncbi:MAG: lipid-binding SYLF domain-containing protein [Planctomycetota bacterium]|nr:lipid-binding SYLF domain-containing protein [Planctomycetota bacterium]
MSLIARPLLHLFAIIISFASAQLVAAQSQEEAIVQAATSILQETMASPLNAIPQSMLSDAHGVAIIPNVLKAGFIVGARHGRGLLFVREANGNWHAPVFISLTGGNIGWQVGVQSSDIILVFRTPRSVQGILSGRLTIGADVAAAAGPVGRQGAVATDGQLQAEIFSYSRSRGLFAGVSIDGSVLRIDQLATGAFYRSPGPNQPVVVPPSALQLTQAIARYTGTAANAATNSTTIVQQNRTNESDVLRAQLVQIAPELFDLVSPEWSNFLALPASLYLVNEHPTAESLQITIDQFNTVASDPKFSQLAGRPEFQSVHALLKHYRQSLSASSSTLQLPPPPPVVEILP